ncbi:MAG: alkaline phosphatase D family protein [Candidatus Hydrogenedentota bacterium]
MSKITRREFGAAAGAGLLLHPVLSSAAESGDTKGTTGPMIGHVSETTVEIWFRPAKTGKYTVVVFQDDKEIRRATERSLSENDQCLTWHVRSLKAKTRYHYSVLDDDGSVVAGYTSDHYFDTAPDPNKLGKVCLAFGSCAHAKPLELWKQIHDQGAQGLVLLGDTPYIDSTRLSIARRKQRDFLAVPDIAQLIRNTSIWGTWDDHDFGKNDSDGTLPGKENSRQAFLEYRANANYGHGSEGIYTRFRYGPIEVFLLDTRWFARTETSPVDPSKPTLLGARQWAWLKKSLKGSTAPFKIIACGMIWDDKENGESDDWGTYSHERSALFDFIGEKNISGVVLIGGDIHCSRLLQYKTEQQVGYPIRQCIVSPIHDSTIPSLNVAHPDLIHGAAIPHVWLRVEVDTTASPATFKADWVQKDGQEMWALELDENDLTRPGRGNRSV